MSDFEPITAIAERLGQHASVSSVYGEPIEFEDTTIVPVAKIGYGFGGGYSSGEDDSAGNGAGGAGGVSATPIGVLESTDDGVQFVRIASRTRTLGAFAAAVVLGIHWARRR